MRLIATSTGTEYLQNTPIVDVVCARDSVGLLSKGPTALGLRHTCPRKAVECTWAGLGLSSLGSQCRCYDVYASVLMLRGKGGNWRHPNPLLLERVLCACCSQGSTPRRPTKLPLDIPGMVPASFLSPERHHCECHLS